MFHVTARGVRKTELFVDDRDRELYLDLLASTIARFRWQCLGYCLMGNHVHLLIQLRLPNLSRGMQRIHGMYAYRFNTRHGHVGHVFDRRFFSSHIASESHLLATFRYIALNPVTARVCSDPADFRWSSFAATARLAPWPRFLARHRIRQVFGGSAANAGVEYAALVRSDLGLMAVDRRHDDRVGARGEGCGEPSIQEGSEHMRPNGPCPRV
jgi:putative transposase